MLTKIVVVLIVLAIPVFILVAKGGFNPPSSSSSSSSEPENQAKQTGCPDPLVLQTPVDISKVTAILYPGQVRGGDFKPHGGFRFDSSKNEEIEVRIPLAATFRAASRYLEEGEVQYLLDFETSCGIRYRFDHLLVLAPKFAEIIEKLPEAKKDDSRTSNIDGEVKVSQDELVATAVGLRGGSNVFVDFGVYKMKGLNIFNNLKESAVCWFDLLSSEDNNKVRSLPSADSASGSQSAYCK